MIVQISDGSIFSLSLPCKRERERAKNAVFWDYPRVKWLKFGSSFALFTLQLFHEVHFGILANVVHAKKGASSGAGRTAIPIQLEFVDTFKLDTMFFFGAGGVKRKPCFLGSIARSV